MINSRASLITYAKQKLGEPVISINTSPEQDSDRVDEALQVMQEQHLAGSEKVFLKHQITSSTLLLSTATAGTFIGQTIVKGTTSGAKATIVTFGTSGSILGIKGIIGTFIAGEPITAGVISAVLSSASNFLTLGDTENQSIILPDSVISVLSILQMTNSAGNGSTNPFDLTYQLRMNDLYNLSSTSLIYYTQVQNHLSMINMLLVGAKPLRFNQHSHILSIDMDWLNYVAVGEYLVVECYRILDPTSITNVYNNLWLKKYTTALIKQQWGSNLQKFGNQVLPGGIVLNGVTIYEQASKELDELLIELSDKWTEHAGFFLG